MKFKFFACTAIAIALCAALLNVSAADTSTIRAVRMDQLAAFKNFNVRSDPARNGFFDPSIEYGDDGIGWMVYSRVTIPARIETHVAKSTNHGASWTYVGTINSSRSATVIKSGKTLRGVWRYETPSLVFDRTDVPARRWKLFVQRYFIKSPYADSDRDLANSWIEYRYAATPKGPWSTPQRLFGKAALGARIDLNKLSPSLRRTSFYTEIGSIASDGVLYLSMDASTDPNDMGDWVNRKIIMIASYNHGRSWHYVGVLTSFADASKAGYLAFTGSSLVEERGRLFALLTPTGKLDWTARTRGHDGVYIVEFADITSATLERDAKRRLKVVKALANGKLAISGGLADYDEQNTRGGLLLPQIMANQPPVVFRTYNTGQRMIQAN